MNTAEQNRLGLDLSVQELEVVIGMSGCSNAGNDPKACDASIGAAIGLSIAGAVIILT